METRVPNKKNLRMWVRALKSGAYPQGKSFMKTSDGKYCCLGVAMDIALANGVTATGMEDWGKTSAMPSAVCKWLGLPDQQDPKLRKAGDSLYGGTSAATLNDQGDSFNAIADRIIHTYQLDSDD